MRGTPLRPAPVEWHVEALIHVGEEDEFIFKAARPQIKALLASKANATLQYTGQGSCLRSA